MSENLPARIAPKANVVAGGRVSALVPRNIEEAFRLAGAMSASGMAPRGMDRPEQVMIAILAGAEIGFAPYQAMQSFAIVNNRATLWGDAIPALLWAHGFKVREWFDDIDRPTQAFCEITRPDGVTIERRYTLDDAKKAGLLTKQGPWQSATSRMLQMRARAFTARDGAADVLKGLAVREEVEDHGPVPAAVREAGTGMRARLEARQPDGEGGFDPAHVAAELDEAVTAEFADADPNIDPPSPEEPVAREIELPPQSAPPPAGPDILAWAAELEAVLSDYAGVDPLREDWSARKSELALADPERFRDLNQKVARRAGEIAGAV